MEENLWVINRTGKKFERTDTELKKHVEIEPLRPYPLPRSIALKYVNNFSCLSFCDNPEVYFEADKMKQLIIRDAGIGDLLLLEPVLRTLSEKGREISILSMYPDVYTFNPNIKTNHKMAGKSIIDIDMKQYDSWEDLRNYSETCASRDKKHRTDCYNEKFNADIKDKEPRLYFHENERSKIRRKANKIYIGLQLDASHSYRRYEKCQELIDYLIKQDKNYVIVVLGGHPYYKLKKNSQVIDMQGKTSIRHAINIIRELDYFIGVDSGLTHVALTLHIPSVCIMSIITPELRLKYYKGQKEVLTKDIECIGCGNKHMFRCQHGDVKTDKGFVAPCLNYKPEEIYNALSKLSINEEKRIFSGEEDNLITQEKKNINILKINKKLIMPIIVLNEEKNLPRFIEMVMKHPCIGKTIAIDGGSKDNTVKMLKNAGAEVYEHYYDKEYHDMQALQRNISCSFVKDGEKIIIMDIDECFSNELDKELYALVESHIIYGLLSRRTFNYFDDINDPEKQIKDYPDWQPRFFTWNRRFKWVGSPHHALLNAPDPAKIQKDIIHFEREGKDRDALEDKWAKMQKATKEIYG
jgi:ADP-heptose:LPS heptosyltransferase